MALRSCLWKCCCEHWRRAPVFVASGSTAVFWGASECLISLSCHPSFFFLGGVIFFFHSQLCSDKMALRSVSRSITDKAWLRGNFQPDQLGLSIVCPEYFGNKWPKLDSIFNTALRKKLTETLKSLSQITLVQPLAKFPKLSFKSGQGHYTYTGGWDTAPDLFPLSKMYPILLIIQPARYDPPGYISHLYSRSLLLYMSHRGQKKEPCEQKEGKLEPLCSEINHLISLVLVKILGCVRECLLNVWHFFIDRY